MDLTSRFLRLNAVQSDIYGVDPLLDTIVPLIHKVVSYTVLEIEPQHEGAPDLISLEQYGTHDLWWVILEYNGIGRPAGLTSGLKIKIPDLAEVTAAFTSASAARDVVLRVVTI